jgi:hypothetical protein
LGPILEDATIRDRAKILAAIESGQRLTMITYSLTDRGERQIDFIIAAILKRYGRQSLQSALYSCMKEVIINATRANAKRVFFEEQGYDIENSEQYRLGTAALKEQISEEWIRTYGQKARARQMDVRITFEHGSEGLRFEVLNSQNIIPADEIRLRQKLDEGMAYDDLVSFYMAQGDQTEGEGIGLVMNLLLLKGENINPALFRIGNVDGRTMARIEIPFNQTFESQRGPEPAGLLQSH